MTSGFAGGYKMESSEARALRSINTESYDYRDQGKLLTKLTTDVSYMAQYMRQMQKGIDDANANFIEQIGDFVNEIITVIGGNGNTSFDFGDLKYIFQAIGALFGFDEQTGIGAIFPINLFNAAWHFFSTYVLPLNNFGDSIDNFIDSSLATILDVLGEVPILGQAAQQLAVWITDFRGAIQQGGEFLGGLLSEWSAPLITAIEETVQVIQNIIDWFTGQANASKAQFEIWAKRLPIMNTTGGVINALNIPGLDGSKITAGTVAAGRIAPLPATAITTGTFLDGLIPNLNASKINAGTFLGSLIPGLDVSKITTGTFGDTFIPSLDAAKIGTGTFGASRLADGAVSNIKLGTDISGDKIVAGTVVAGRIGNLDGSKITTGQIGTAIVPNLDAGKITTGSFGAAFITDGAVNNAKLGADISGDKIVAGTVVAGRIGALDASKVTTGNFAESRIVNLSSNLGLFRTKQRDNLNLAAGSDFDGASNPWNTIAGYFELDATTYNSGTQSLKITAGPISNNTIVYGDGANSISYFEAKPNEQFYVEMWIRRSTTWTAPDTSGPRFRITRGNGPSAGTTFGNFIITAAQMPLADTWYKVSSTFTMVNEAGVNSIALMFTGPLNTGTGTLWVDDIVVRRVANHAGLFGDGVIGNAKLGTDISGDKIVAGTVTAARVGALDVSKITTGTFGDTFIPNLAASKITTGTFLDGLIPNLNASKINAGTFLGSLIPGLDVSKIISGVFGDTFIPNLAATKITSGTFLDSLIPNLNASKVTAGTFLGGLIPALDSSKITTGNFDQTRVNNLTGDLAARRKLADTANIAVDPSFELNAETLITGAPMSRNTTDGIVRSGTASMKFVSNAATTSRVYVTSLSSAKRHQCSGNDVFYVEMWIQGKGSTNVANTTGTFQIYAGAYTADNVFIQWVSGPAVTLTTALNDIWTKVSGYITVPATCRQFEVFGQFQTVSGIPSGYTYYVDDVVLKEVTESNVINKSLFNSNNPLSAILAAIVPNLDGSKITTGTIGTGIIPNLDAGKITTGSFLDARIPNLDAAKIATGSFLDARIPTLDAAKIGTGSFLDARIPSLDAAKIATGSFLDARIPGLDASKITGGTLNDTRIPTLAQAKVSGLTTDILTTKDLARGSLRRGANLVSNPGFEAGTFLDNANADTSVKRTGARSVKLTADAVNYKVVYLTCDEDSFITIPAIAGDIFYVEAYVLRAGIVPTTGNIWIQADVYNSAGTAINYPNNGPVAATSISSTASSWTKISGYITMPANTASVSFMVVVGNTVTSGSIFYFDDVVVKEYTHSAGINTTLFNQTTPGTNILAGVIPGLDGSKINTGTLAEDRIASLSAGKITSGTFLDARIPSLDAAKISTGAFLDARIPSLDAAKIATGAFLDARIPGLDASKITGGTLNDTRIPTLAQSKITSLTTDLGNRVDYSAYQSFISGGASNLSTNPSFEDTTQYLSGQTYNSNATYVRSGTRSAALIGDGVNNEWLTFCNNKTAEIWLQTQPSRIYYMEMYVMGDANNSASTAGLRGGIWVYPGTSTTAITSYSLPFLSQATVGTGTWVKWSGYLKLGSTSTIARMRPLIYAEISNNTYYIDDVTIIDVTEAVQINTALYNADLPATQIQGTALPTVIDASKLSTGTLPAGAIGAGSIDNTKIASGVDAAKLTTGTLPVARIAAGAITNTYLGSDVDAAKLTTGTLPIARIAAGAVDNTKLAATGLDAAKLTVGTLPIARIADAAITTAKIGDSQITTAKIGDSQITGVKTAGLDGSKITGGTIAENLVENLTPTRTDVQNTFNKLSGVLANGEDNVTSSVIDNVVASLLKTYNTLQDHSIEIQKLQSAKTSSQVKGAAFSVNFNSYSNGAFSTTAAPGTETFFVIYSGAGTSSMGVQGGIAQWFSTNNADRDAKVIWNKSTNTDFQILTGTMTTPPMQPAGGASAPKFHAIGRVNSAGTTYVWARAYCDGFLSFKGEIGCTVAGTEYQWATNIPLTWSLDMKFVLGVGTNARQYQIYSGSTLVWTHTESGTANVNYTTKTSTSAVQSTLGASNRQWGALAQIRGGTNGPYHSGKLSGASMSDNESPTVNGSFARMDRTSTTAVSYVGGGALTAIPNSFFNVIDYESPDIDANTTDGTFTVTESKPYIITGRVITGNVAAWGTLILEVWNGVAWGNATGGGGSQYGDPIYTQDAAAALYGQWIQYLTAGQKVRLAYERAGVTVTALNGEATGSKTYFSIVGAG